MSTTTHFGPESQALTLAEIAALARKGDVIRFMPQAAATAEAAVCTASTSSGAETCITPVLLQSQR